MANANGAGRRKIESFAIGFNDFRIFISILVPLREPLRDRVDSETSRVHSCTCIVILYFV